MFSALDYAKLHEIVFRLHADGMPAYPGYRPQIVESPNGDGVKDTEKKYAHVSTKYLAEMCDGIEKDTLNYYHTRSFEESLRIALRLRIPPEFWPSYSHGALRVLEYPVGSGSAAHTDVSLLTVNLYRDQPNKLSTFAPGSGWTSSDTVPTYHLGRLGREVGAGTASPHMVIPSDTIQKSLVYFAVCDHGQTLPSGQNVGEWVSREMSKMRYE